MKTQKNRRKKGQAARQLRWVWSRAGRCRYGLFLTALLQTASALNVLLVPLVFRALVDGAVGGRQGTFVFAFVGYAALSVFQTLLWSLQFHLNRRVDFQIEWSIRASLYEGLLHTEYGALRGRSLGELNSHLNSDVRIVTSGLMYLLPGVLSVLIRAGGAAVILFQWEPQFLALYGAVLAGAAVSLRFLRRPMKRLQKELRKSADAVQAVQQDTLGNTVVIRSFLAWNSAMAAWQGRMREMKESVYRQNRFSNLLHTGYRALSELGYLGCLLWFGGGLLEGRVSYGTLAAALQLVGQVQNPFGDLTRLASSWYSFQASAERLMELDALPKETARPLPFRELGTIRLRGVCSGYDPEYPVLKGVSLEIRPGDCIGVVGESGAGKSTLLRLLLALCPVQAGTASVEDRAGTVYPLSPAVRGLFAYVPQGHSVIAGTIEQIVAFRYDETPFSPEEKGRIRAACALACADGFIGRLPQGYESRLGEDGAGVSEGQLQRLAIARAIYYGAPVLLLDEATSGLDAATERRLLANLRTLKDRTVLAVAHTPQALEICTRILRVKEATIYEETPDVFGATGRPAGVRVSDRPAAGGAGAV